MSMEMQYLMKSLTFFCMESSCGRTVLNIFVIIILEYYQADDKRAKTSSC